MAFTRPTLKDLIKRVEGDFKAALSLPTILRRSMIAATSRALAGLAHMLLGYLADIEKQSMPDTATTNLLRWGSVWGVYPKTATFAEFLCIVTGTPGVVIPDNRSYRRTDGVEYVTEGEVVIGGTGTGTIRLVAIIAGDNGNVAEGDKIGILAPIAGLESQATVSQIVIDADDAEVPENPTDEQLEPFRQRVIARIQNPPSGGTATDYIAWALEVAGITRSWVSPQGLGPGTVVVYVVSDDEDPITPSPAKIDEVFQHIELVRPVTANVTVTSPVLLPLDMLISIKPNTTAVQEAVLAELQDLIDRDAAVAGTYSGVNAVHDGKILLSRINEAISIAAGEADHKLETINGVAPADIEPEDGELIVLGDITWQNLA